MTAMQQEQRLLRDAPTLGAGKDRVRTESSGVKRYNLVLPEDLYNEVQRLAEDRHTTVVELIRRFIKLGLLAVQIEESPGKALLIQDGDVMREVLLLA